MGLLEYTPGKVILLHRRPFWLKEAGDWATLAPTRLANDARASTASQSGKSKGEASPPIVHTLPAPTREPELLLFFPLAFNGTRLFEQPAKERD